MALAAGRAILMQLAHPEIAAGIAEHSDFRSDPMARILRTAVAFRSFFFRTQREALSAAARVNAIHDRVRGAGYAARDPALLLWVHATTVQSMAGAYSQLVRKLSPDEHRRFYAESMEIAELLGCPRTYQPDDLEAFETYVDSMVESLGPSDTGRGLVRELLSVPVRPFGKPVMWLYRLLIVGALPERLRAQLVLRWPRPSRVVWRARKLIRKPLIGTRALARATRRGPAEPEGRCRDCGEWSSELTLRGRCPECGRARGDVLLRRVAIVGRLLGLSDPTPNRRAA
jgi:uncharacterized protein (DUF2236 family)